MLETLLAVAPIALISVFVLYHWLLWRALTAIGQRRHRRLNALVWLGLVPIFGLPVTLCGSLYLQSRIMCENRTAVANGLHVLLAMLASLSIAALFLPWIGPTMTMLGAPAWIAHSRLMWRTGCKTRKPQSALTMSRFADGAVFWGWLGLIAIGTATATAAAFRLSIWSESGLWSEPVARIATYARMRDIWTGFTIAMICALPWVWMITSERKQVILYLRKFRDKGVNAAIQRAVRKEMVERFRLITLDDQSFLPISASTRTWATSGAMLVAGTCLFLAFLGMMSIYLTQGLAGYAQAIGLIRGVPMIALLLPLHFWRRPEDVGELLVQLLGDLPDGAAEYYSGMINGLVFGFGTTYFGFAVILAAAGLVAIATLFRVRLTSRSKVSSLEELDRFCRRLARIGRLRNAPSVAVPPASVVTVETAIWQPSVLAIAKIADVIVIDVSEMSEAIAWEVEEMLARHPHCCLFLAGRHRIADWSEKHPSLAQNLDSSVRLLEYDAGGIDPVELTQALSALAPAHGSALDHVLGSVFARRRYLAKAALALAVLLSPLLLARWFSADHAPVNSEEAAVSTRTERPSDSSDTSETSLRQSETPAADDSRTESVYPDWCTKHSDLKAKFRPLVPISAIALFGTPKEDVLRFASHMSTYFGEETYSVAEIAAATVEKARGMSVKLTRIPIVVEGEAHILLVSPETAGMQKAMILGNAATETGLLVLNAKRIQGPALTDRLVSLRRSGVSALGIYLYGADSKDQIPAVRRALDAADFDSDVVPVVLAPPLSEDETFEDEEAMRDLAREVRSIMPLQAPAYEQPFLMPVEDTIAIQGRDVIVTGRVARGVVGENDLLELVGFGQALSVSSTGIEMFRKDLNCGVPGSNIGVALQGVSASDIKRGQILAAPGTVRGHARIEAQVVLVVEDEDGPGTLALSGDRLQLHLHTATIPARLDTGGELIHPDLPTLMTFTLDEPVGLEIGVRFALRAGEETIGAGRVVSFLD